jgi:hypothetical protein
LLIFFGLLPLFSCVDVEDFGDSWRKAGTDKRLVGSWEIVPASPEETRETGNTIGGVWRVHEKGGAYEVTFHRAGRAPDDQPLYPIKTMNVGRFQFLLIGQTKGQLIRYKLRGQTLHVCIPFLVEYVREFYPNAANIRNEGEDSVSDILRFDRAVFDIIAQVPDTEDYWTCDFMRLRKLAP